MIKENALANIRLLYIEDDAAIREELSSILSDMCLNLYTAVDGLDGLHKFKENKPDMIFTDILMPRLDGISMIEKIREIDKHIPIIISSALKDSNYLLQAINLGINNYLLKPLNLYRLFDSLGAQATQLRVKKELSEIDNKDLISQNEIITMLGNLGDFRTKELGTHIERMSEYSKLLALKAGLGEEIAQELKLASCMHDIGHIGVPEVILNKAEKLSPDEFEIIKTHAKLGYEMLRHSNHKLLRTASIIAHQHHEKFDGSGYPNALEGENIHIYGRITAIADVFDSLSQNSVYKKAWPLEKILELFKTQSAQHFDPKLIKIFNNYLDEFIEIKDHYECL